MGALKQETVSLMCGVESHPQPLTFHWTFNNSGELIEVPQSRYSHVPAVGSPTAAESLKEYQQFHGSRLNYTPATEMDYGTVACWASNQVGKQRTPCLFQASIHSLLSTINSLLSFIFRYHLFTLFIAHLLLHHFQEASPNLEFANLNPIQP